jgi:hypothetical protein
MSNLIYIQQRNLTRHRMRRDRTAAELEVETPGSVLAVFQVI